MVALIEDFGLQPILAVVPDNRDEELLRSPADPGFWAQMRVLEAAGATIGLHGYRHLCLSRGRSLAGFGRQTEFAGVPEATQREWIGEGLGILRGHGLHPRVWVAPRHGFDANTLRALREEGILFLSDGLARVPFMRGGVVWIPQQLWVPCEKKLGLWTICLHPNTMHAEDFDRLREFVRRHAAQFTSVDRVLAEFPPVHLPAVERGYEQFALGRLQLIGLRKRLLHRK